MGGCNFHKSPIPTFFGNIKRLIYLNLSHANFSGKVSRMLGNLTRLHMLDLSDLTRVQIDDSRWALQLSSLQHLDMSQVPLPKTLNLVQVLNMPPSLSNSHVTKK